MFVKFNACNCCTRRKCAFFNDYIAKTQSETEKDINKSLYLCIAIFWQRDSSLMLNPFSSNIYNRFFFIIILRYYGQFKKFLQENMFFFKKWTKQMFSVFNSWLHVFSFIILKKHTILFFET